MLQKLPLQRVKGERLFAVFTDSMKFLIFVCLYNPNTCLPSCSFTVRVFSWPSQSNHKTDVIVPVCSIVRGKVQQIRVRRQLMSYALGLWLPRDKRRTLETQYLHQRGGSERRSRLKKEGGGGGRPEQRTEVSPGLMPWQARKDSWAAGLAKWLILKTRGPRLTLVLYSGDSGDTEVEVKKTVVNKVFF